MCFAAANPAVMVRSDGGAWLQTMLDDRLDKRRSGANVSAETPHLLYVLQPERARSDPSNPQIRTVSHPERCRQQVIPLRRPEASRAIIPATGPAAKLMQRVAGSSRGRH